MKICDAIRMRIKELSNETGKIEYMLVYHSGIPPSTVKNILYGQSQNPGIVTIKKIADFYGVSMRTFYSSEVFNDLEQED